MCDGLNNRTGCSKLAKFEFDGKLVCLYPVLPSFLSKLRNPHLLDAVNFLDKLGIFTIHSFDEDWVDTAYEHCVMVVH